MERLNESLVYPSEFDLIRKDGRIITVRDFPRAVLNPEGKILNYTGILVDITEQRATEKKLHHALVALEKSNRERQVMIKRLKNLSLLDDLTQLYNRRGFLSEAEQRLKRSLKRKIKMFFLFMDLDNLKWINDSWGHQKGDQALQQFSSILKKCLRRSDAMGRVGGDEFAALAEETTGFTPSVLVERLQTRIAEFNATRRYPFSLSISMGISYFDPEFPCSLEELMIRADKLMYEQKRVKSPF